MMKHEDQVLALLQKQIGNTDEVNDIAIPPKKWPTSGSTL